MHMLRIIAWVREWPGKHGYVLELFGSISRWLFQILAGIVGGCVFIAWIQAVIYIVEVLLAPHT